MAAPLATVAAEPAAQTAVGARLRLGLDLFSIRNQGWSALEFLDYAAKLGVEMVHFSEPRFLGGLEESHLRSEERRVGKECRSRWSPYH